MKRFPSKFFRQRGTVVKPKKKWTKDTEKYNLHKRSRASLKAGIDLQEAVILPPNEQLDDWLSVHVVDFYNRISLIYASVLRFCTEQSCPIMSGGSRFEYLWADNDQYKEPTSLPAPKYMELLLDWVDQKVNDETIFPQNTDVPFPSNFRDTIKVLFKRLHRVFVHVYIHHFREVREVGLEAHVNQCYKHFYYFIVEFQLVDNRELEPLKEMTRSLCRI